MLLEISSYILSAMSGNLLSEGIVSKNMKKNIKKVIKFNLYVLFIAIIILVAGMIVETFVLNNFETYKLIGTLAFG